MKNAFLRELSLIRHNGLYMACLVGFPLLVMIFFTSLMAEGQPADMPVGVVDLDNSSTSRKIVRSLDAFQNTHIAGSYSDVAAAREAMQKGEIYAFIYFPRDCATNMIAGRQPGISFYYTMSFLSAGSLLLSDLKTIATLGYAGVAKAKMQAMGVPESQIMPLLQPIKVELHRVGNPGTDYNAYLSPMLVPGVMLLFIFIFTAYSIGLELKFGRSKEWLDTAGGNIFVALTGKMLPQTILSMTMMSLYLKYIYIWRDGIPSRGRLGCDFPLGGTHGDGSRGIRHIHVFAPASREDVYECMLSVGGTQFLDGGNSLPCDGDGPGIEVIGMAIPSEALFRDLPDECLQWFPPDGLLAACSLPLRLRPAPPSADGETEEGDDGG